MTGAARTAVFFAIFCGLALPVLAQDAPTARPVEQSADRPPETASGDDVTAPLQGARPPDRPEDLAEPENAETPPPAPENLPEPAAEVPAAIPEPLAPPIPQTLRESDFDYSACLLSLSVIGATYEEIAPITDPDQRDCGIARPVQISEILPGVALEGGAPMRCDTARALAMWTRDFVQPSARRLAGSPQLTGMQLGTTYQCRDRVGTAAEDVKMSEHAYGNAIDIAAFTFQNNDPIGIEPRQETGDLTESFQRAVRGSACLFFTTVLGPGSNAAHDNHLHLDLAARRNGWRLCE